MIDRIVNVVRCAENRKKAITTNIIAPRGRRMFHGKLLYVVLFHVILLLHTFEPGTLIMRLKSKRRWRRRNVCVCGRKSQLLCQN